MEYLIHLSKDKKLGKLIGRQQPFRLNKREDMHHYLCVSIMSQQLSVKVADTIHKRFLNIYDGRVPLAEEILATPFETLRAIGLSNAKVGYVHNVARFAIDQGMDHRRLDKMDNEEVIGYLTQIKGVGRWTVEMLLMFGLGREDVFAIDDWGIQNAMINIYKLDRTDKKAFREELLRISKKWSPFRTYACLHLWRWKDNIPAPAVAAKRAASGKKAAPGKRAASGKKAAPAKKAAPSKKVATPVRKASSSSKKARPSAGKGAHARKVSPSKKPATAKKVTSAKKR